jgi:hypothetical protein
MLFSSVSRMALKLVYEIPTQSTVILHSSRLAHAEYPAVSVSANFSRSLRLRNTPGRPGCLVTESLISSGWVYGCLLDSVKTQSDF